MTDTMDSLKLYKLSARAKMQTRKPLPFDEFIDKADARADKSFTFDTNKFDRALFKYVAGLRGESMRGAIRRLAREAALRIVMGQEP